MEAGPIYLEESRDSHGKTVDTPEPSSGQGKTVKIKAVHCAGFLAGAEKEVSILIQSQIITALMQHIWRQKGIDCILFVAGDFTRCVFDDALVSRLITLTGKGTGLRRDFSCKCSILTMH